MRGTPLFGVLGALLLLGTAAVPAARAAPTDRPDADHDRGRHGHRHHHADDDRVTAIVVVNLPDSVGAGPFASSLAALPQMVPGAQFPQGSPQLLPVSGNGFALNNRALFCGPDQDGTCQLLAQQLNQIAPGWGTTFLNGPQGFGVYLVYRGTF